MCICVITVVVSDLKQNKTNMMKCDLIFLMDSSGVHIFQESMQLLGKVDSDN